MSDPRALEGPRCTPTPPHLKVRPKVAKQSRTFDETKRTERERKVAAVTRERGGERQEQTCFLERLSISSVGAQVRGGSPHSEFGCLAAGMCVGA